MNIIRTAVSNMENALDLYLDKSVSRVIKKKSLYINLLLSINYILMETCLTKKKENDKKLSSLLLTSTNAPYISKI